MNEKPGISVAIKSYSSGRRILLLLSDFCVLKFTYPEARKQACRETGS